MHSMGRTKVYGETRTLQAQVFSPGWQAAALGNAAYGSASSAGVTVSLSYQAEVAHLSLDVGVPSIIQWLRNYPTYKELDAYASRGYLGQSNPDSPIEFFWDGYASYSASVSPDLLSAINRNNLGTFGNPVYDWSVSGKTYSSFHLSYGRDTNNWPYVGANVPATETPTGNTTFKNLHHDLGGRDAEFPQSTVTKLKITGGNGVDELTAKAKINWYNFPTTEFTLEFETIGIDLETGQEVNLDSGGLYSTEAAMLAMKQELRSEPGSSGIAGKAWETESGFRTPDDSYFSYYERKRFTRNGYNIDAASSRVRELLSNNSAKLMATARTRLGRGDDYPVPVVVRIREKTTLTGQGGKLPPNSWRDPLPTNRVTNRTTYLGQFCFVAGTLVDTQPRQTRYRKPEDGRFGVGQRRSHGRRGS